MALQIVRQVTLVLFTIQPTGLLCVISRPTTGVKRLPAILTSRRSDFLLGVTTF